MELEKLPIINFSRLHHDSVIKQIHEACRNFGFFHVMNHGISDSVIEEALNVNSNFFGLPVAMKEEFNSDDVQKPVRFSRLQIGCHENEMLSRDFLKLYAHPLHHFVNLWPSNPLKYREKMGMYATEVRKLGIELFGAIMESLNLSPTYLKQNFEQGVQIIGINSYPPCSGSSIKTGTAAHTDHSIITILLQSSPGLHIMDRSDGAWKSDLKTKGSLKVLVGDHLEVISNGLYKSVLHRAISSSNNCTRLSIADFHSLGMDDIVEPATELVDEDHPKRYRGSSLRDYLEHLSSKDATPFNHKIKI
ncbi:2-oxoglutarate (2OG) and Fe(II)-dependent oxygenase superfamily protein [Forsythia ovata]|uniref:2-oxoglutarate (2OG) and Fe(II)-dependent oxygenase superfamily protein n=1 Tax=Forsythia ovata TaxID=205694 RepID=A0ABD1RMS7_9LAMI